LADGLGLAGGHAVALAQAASPQVGVEFRPVVDLGDGRGPVLLQELDAALDARLLLGSSHQAEEGLEQVMTGQGLIALVELAIPADQHLGRHRLGIVPPEFVWHAAKEGEGFDQTVQNGLGAFGGQGQSKGAVGVGPGDQQHGHELAALGKIDVDVPKVGFEALARIVVEGDEGLGGPRPLGADVKADALDAAGIAMLVPQAAEHFGGGVALLTGRVGVGAEDVIDDSCEGVEDGRRGRASAVGLGFGLAEDLADLAAGVMEAPSEFADTELVDDMGSADACVLVHLDHPSPPGSWTPKR
jgi:hypothetical protein